MRKHLLWVGAALVLIAIPAVVGLVALRGDDSASARRAAALVQEGSPAAAYQLTVGNITQAGEAIDVSSYSWGVKGAPVVLGGLTSGKAQFGNLEITKKLDETSPLFVKAAAMGDKLPSAVLTVYQAGGGQAYAKYTLTNAYVEHVQHGGSADAIPTEQISLTYAKLEVEISSIAEGGKVSGTRTFVYDLAAAKS